MYPQEQKEQFIQMRAAGKSYNAIARDLHIAKGTCVAWQRELATHIDEAKQERLTELYDAYHMGREARIKNLGNTLAAIDEAIVAADFNEVPLSRLLDLKLKYAAALKEEYISAEQPPIFMGGDVNGEKIIEALGDLLDRVRKGEVATDQANKEASILSYLLKAYEQAELKAKMDALEMVLSSTRS